MPRKSQLTRQRIIDTASQLFYQQGYQATSFSHIEKASGIPRGNIYYYFKSKQELLIATLDYRAVRIKLMLFHWSEQYRTPEERLYRFLELLPDNSKALARWGCPMGTLNAELGKNNQEIQQRVAGLFRLFEDWLCDQFSEMGYAGQARKLARHLLARGQGISMLTHVLNDKNFLIQETSALELWIDHLASADNDNIGEPLPIL